MADLFSEWYERVYPQLAGHGLWLRGGELNTLPADDFLKRPFRVLFSRLSSYADTLESFTHQRLYQVARAVDGCFPDLAYLPPREDGRRMVQDGIPWLLGTQSHRGPMDFQLIGFSNSILQELVNLPAMLKHSGLPPGKRARMEQPAVPLIILGGANALHTTVFWLADPPVDGVFVGESPRVIRLLLEICRDGFASGASKRDILERLAAGVPGFILPDAPRPTRKETEKVEAVDSVSPDGPIPWDGAQAGRGHLRISEGCPCFCTFCAESFTRKPYREKPATVVQADALSMKRAMGLDSVELYSFNFNMHAEIRRILWALVPLFRDIGLKSQRMDLIARDPKLLEFLHAVGKTTLTCGVEGVSARMRRYLGKSLSNEDLSAGFRAILRSPIRELKVFLIITGLEQEGDWRDLTSLVNFLDRTVKMAERKPRMIFSMTPLVRFAGTPLEFADACPASRMASCMEEAGGIIRRCFEVRSAAGPAEYWLSQVLARAADTRVGEAFLAAIEETGFIYSRDVSDRFTAVFRKALEMRGLQPDALLVGHSFEAGEGKPWTVLDTGVRRRFLYDQFKAAENFSDTPSCLGLPIGGGSCLVCGACAGIEAVQEMTAARPMEGITADAFKKRIQTSRADEQRVRLALFVDDRARGVGHPLVGMALARALMQSEPDFVGDYRGYEGAGRGGRPGWEWVTGLDVMTLRWRKGGVALLEERLSSPVWLETIQGAMAGWGRLVGLAPDEETDCVVLETRSPFEFLPKEWFVESGIKCTQKRRPEGGGYVFEIAKDSLKRRLVYELVSIPEAGAWRLRLTVGDRFSVADFAARAFVLPDEDAWVRIRFSAE